MTANTTSPIPPDVATPTKALLTAIGVLGTDEDIKEAKKSEGGTPYSLQVVESGVLFLTKG